MTAITLLMSVSNYLLVGYSHATYEGQDDHHSMINLTMINLIQHRVKAASPDHVGKHKAPVQTCFSHLICRI